MQALLQTFIPIKALLKVTFNFSSALVLLTVSINKVRHSYLVKWLIMKSDCSRNEAAAKMLNAYHLGKGFESCVCASACMCVFVSSVDFDRRRHTQLSALSSGWKFSAVFPPGGHALHFGLIKVIFHKYFIQFSHLVFWNSHIKYFLNKAS